MQVEVPAVPRALAAGLTRFLRVVAPRHPAQVIVLGFAAAVAVGTGLLLLPVAKADGGGASLLEALFTATSAVCVTGLITVDTPVFWSGFGQVVILVLIQIGGFGVMSFGTLLGVLTARRLGLKSRISAAAETKSSGFGDVRRVLVGVLLISVVVEAALALILTVRFMAGYGYSLGEAVWHGIFHSISSFNNAGFALYSDNLMGFVGDPWICLPIAAAVIIGGLGFPVLFELGRQYRRPIHWSMNTKLVLVGSGHPPGRRNRLPHRRRVGQPGNPGRSPSGRARAGRLFPVRHYPHRRLQQHRHRPDESRVLAGHGHHDVHRRRPGRYGRRPEDHHVRRAVLHPQHRAAGRHGREHLRQATVPRGAPPGHYRGAAGDRPRHRLHDVPDADHRLRAGADPVRGHFGLRHGRPVHRHHRRHAARRVSSC